MTSNLSVFSKNLCQVTVFTTSLLLSSLAFAGCTAALCNGKLVETLVTSNFMFVDTDGNEGNLNCTLANGRFIRFSKNENTFRDWYAQILTAKSLDDAVTIGIVAGSDPCEPAYVSLGR